MKINLWGVRGSIQTSGPATKNYGSRTSSVLVSEDDDLLILDAGSGIQEFNSIPLTTKRIDILLTHLHMDHIQGLGFFNPFFNDDLEVHIWGPAFHDQSLRSRLSRYLSPPLFPVLLRDLPCKLTLHEVGNKSFKIGHFKIKSNYIIHPSPTIGYRVTGNQSTFTYMPDHEPALGKNGMIKDQKWISAFDLAASADLLYHDGQYSSKEYVNKKGWGHSSMDDALLFSSLCEVKHLLIAHHDPYHSDDQLNELFRDLQLNNKCVFKYEMATEGMEVELP
ncbi:MAG: MBL fold metallo-hydrolase [Ginsengibacter sp.]